MGIRWINPCHFSNLYPIKKIKVVLQDPTPNIPFNHQLRNKNDITMADNNSCPFCNIEPDRILYEDAYCFTVRDGYPVAKGHSLIVPKRHITSFFETTKQEKDALLNALESAKTNLDSEFIPDAYNIGINDGSEAGQTIPHLHIHLIPRYRGDVPDPRGGIRWIIPDKAIYWSSSQ